MRLELRLLPGLADEPGDRYSMLLVVRSSRRCPVKSNEEWELQRERLAWRISIRDSVPYLEARDLVHERAIKLGRSPGNVKLLRMVRKHMRRQQLSFRIAAGEILNRIASFWMKRFVGGVCELAQKR